MSAELRERAKAFLSRPLPKGLLRGSMAEGFLTHYARTGSLDEDPEVMELVQMCIQDSLAVAEAAPPAHAEYLRESAALLQDLLAERGA